jgi:hypothetical protein
MVKLQHYVPQSYLKQFACEKGKNAKIWCFDKVRRNTFKTNVRNVGGERYFYHAQQETEQPLEETFGELESRFVPARDRLMQMPDLSALSPDDQTIIALFVASLLVRTSEHRQQVADMMEQMHEWLRNQSATEELRAAFGPATEEQARLQQMYNRNGETITQLAETIVEMKWIRLWNRTSVPFWCSDHPVTLYNPIGAGPRGNLGLRCTGIQLYLPLTPQLTLAACDPIMYADRPNEGRVVVDNINFQNSLQVPSSHRHLFSVTRDFALAEQILAEHPEFADPDRRRTNIG